MNEVASRLAEVEDVKHTIYADNITLWVEGGSDARVEEALQRAVQTVEERQGHRPEMLTQQV